MFLVALAALTGMMILVGVVREALMQNLPPSQVVRLIPYILPDALRVAVPVTLLLATTSVYGRMAGCNEVLAIKASGVSPMVILWPTYALAVLLSLATVWLNDLAVAWGRNGAQRVVVGAVEQIAYNMLRTQRSYSSPHFSINVRDVVDRTLLSPTISIAARDGNPGMTVTAEHAALQSDRAAEMLVVTLHNVTLDVEGQVTVHLDKHVQKIPLRDASRAKRVSGLPSWMPLSAIPEEKIAQRRRVQQKDRELAALAAFQMLSGDFHELTSSQWQERLHERVLCWGQLHRLRTEPHRRFSAGFACLCFAWVGAPVAMRRRRGDFLTSFFLCFLPILVVYYPLLAYGVDGAKSGTIPPYSVWAGNALLLLWGALVLKKVVRY